MARHYAGLDLGQANDYSALVVVEAVPERARVVLVERFRGLPYTQAVARVLARLMQLPDVVLLFDQTGVGRAVGDLLLERARGLTLVPVTIHGGERIRRSAAGLAVPKRALLAPLQALLGAGRLELPAGPLVEELRHFAVKVDRRTGHDRYEARRGHDDLVVAAALACLPLAPARGKASAA